jgi:hypothetical protein
MRLAKRERPAGHAQAEPTTQEQQERGQPKRRKRNENGDDPRNSDADNLDNAKVTASPATSAGKAE